MIDVYIVAEVSKNWAGGHAVDGRDDVPIAKLFEAVINVNWRRGYQLVNFQLHRVSWTADTLNETIIAVFSNLAGGE